MLDDCRVLVLCGSALAYMHTVRQHIAQVAYQQHSGQVDNDVADQDM